MAYIVVRTKDSLAWDGYTFGTKENAIKYDTENEASKVAHELLMAQQYGASFSVMPL